jgi:acetoin:2,6-dichlorophenolindophenol oxidoreductase subunit alpha
MRRVDRREQERTALEEIGGVKLHLGVEVGPVIREARDLLVPLLGKRPRASRRLRRGVHRPFRGAGDVDPAADSLRIEPREDASWISSVPHLQTEGAPCASGTEGAEHERGLVGVLVLGDHERHQRLGPGVGQTRLDLAPLLGQSHERKCRARWIRCRRVVRVEEREQVAGSERLQDFLREMLLIRRFEEKVEERFRAGELPGFLHVAIGQEAVAVGVCRALEDGDVIASTHRAHGHTIAKGTHPNEVMAELYGKVEGCSHGYGGSMHLYDLERGNLGANAVVGGGLPAIVGAALAFKMRKEPRVAVAFFGDGATNIGTFHEALNLAELWKVPAVFVCENNHYAESTPSKQQLPIEDLTKRAEAYGMTAVKVDGQDVEAVFKTTQKALKHARDGEGPVFLLAETYRLTGHYIGDPQVYRPKEEVREVRQTQDPITKLREKLELSDSEWEELDAEATKLAEDSVAFAKQGTDPKPEDALKNVYA